MNEPAVRTPDGNGEVFPDALTSTFYASVQTYSYGRDGREQEGGGGLQAAAHFPSDSGKKNTSHADFLLLSLPFFPFDIWNSLSAILILAG